MRIQINQTNPQKFDKLRESAEIQLNYADSEKSDEFSQIRRIHGDPTNSQGKQYCTGTLALI